MKKLICRLISDRGADRDDEQLFRKRDKKSSDYERNYRRYQETPTHTGGVSDEYEKRRRIREEKERQREEKHYVKNRKEDDVFKRPRDYDYRDSR